MVERHTAILTISGDEDVVSYLEMQMRGKDAFKDFKPTTILRHPKVVVIKVKEL